MNDLYLIWMNLFRKPLRTVLLIVSIFIAFLIFGLLVGVNVALNRATETGSASNRMVVANKINFTEPLPIAYLNRVSAIPGVVGATHQS